MNNPVYLIIRREYLERVRRKSFILTTILTPLFFMLMMGLPAAIALLAGPEEKRIAVIDDSCVIAPFLTDIEELQFVRTDASLDSAKRCEDYDAVLHIGKDIIDNPDAVAIYSRESSSMTTEQILATQISSIIEQHRLARYDIPNLPQILESINADVHFTSYRIGDDEEQATSSIASYIMGMVMMMILYMFIILYGQMVMTSIIEEKNNRVLEIVVSSMSPRALMLGKILGIGAVALTQIVIWASILFAFTSWVLPMLTAGLPAGDMDLAAMMSTLGDTGLIMELFGFLALFLVGGYLFYSSLYAAIGSSVDNIQDASQLQTVALLPVILGLMLSMTVVNDPNSSLAVWSSMIPFTAPMVMMARMPFGIPVWEIIVSLAVLYASTLLMIWFAAKVYRVGIFMYGKKPTVKELIRWCRYK